MILATLFIIMISHWFADFVCQSHKQAINKSISNYWLTKHVATYSIVMAIILGSYTLGLGTFDFGNLYLFTVATFVLHFITDYFTSRWVKYYFSRENFHNGFVVIGVDQMLHYIQLVGFYLLLL